MTSLYEAARDLMTTVEFAIKAGDWKVDGACDPTIDLTRLRRALAWQEKRHFCPDWDFMEITAQDPEMDGCTCYGPKPTFDCTDEQLIEEVRRRGFVIRDAQVGAKWVGLTHEERDEIDQTCRSQMEALFTIEAKLKEKNA